MDMRRKVLWCLSRDVSEADCVAELMRMYQELVEKEILI